MKKTLRFLLLVIICILTCLPVGCQKKDEVVTDITIIADSTMEIGESQIVKISNNVGTLDYSEYAITSSNKNVATVDANGCVVALSKGTTTITVSTNGVIEEFIITVINAPVKYITNRTVFHKKDYQTFLFSLMDANNNYIESSGTADIRIINSLGVEVYQELHVFNEGDFATWTSPSYGNTQRYLGCGIEIKDSEIAKGRSATGKLYVTIKAENASFSEAAFSINDLPLDASVTIAKASGTYTRYNFGQTAIYSITTVKNASVSYTSSSSGGLRVSLKITCECSYLGTNWDNSTVGYKVYNEAGALVYTGDITMLNVRVGQAWEETEDFFLDDIGNYTIKLCDTN